jgi:hypothetical protein
LAVEGLAAVALERAAPIEATRLLAATTAHRSELGLAGGFYPIGDEVRESTLVAARVNENRAGGEDEDDETTPLGRGGWLLPLQLS